MRADEFIREEEKLDEVLPLITGAAALAGGAMKLAGGVASGAGAVAKGVGKGIGAAARGVGQGVGNVASKVGQQKDQNKIGEPDTTDEKDPAKRAAIDRIKDQSIKPGAELDLPTVGPGGTEKFKVSRVTGDDVEIENPNPAPGEPNKTVYKKQDLKKSITL
jgi:hypothetical protein